MSRRAANGRRVLHLDKDFDLIAGLTGQTIERLTIEAHDPTGG